MAMRECTGHVVMVRVVESIDAMTADWTRLPYEVIERISNRITNEVEGATWVTVRSVEQATGDDRAAVKRECALPERENTSKRVARIGSRRYGCYMPRQATIRFCLDGEPFEKKSSTQVTKPEFKIVY